MKKLISIPLFLVVLLTLVVQSCATTQYIPVEKETTEKVIVKDSLVYRDSIVYVPQERIVEIVPQLDTLFMEIEAAESKAYLDTTNMLLRGELKSKKKESVKYQTIIEYRDRIDTVYIKEPQPYEVIKTEYKYNNLFWFSIIFNILVLVFIGLRIYLKLKG